MSILEGLNLLNEKLNRLLEDVKNLTSQNEELNRRVTDLENEIII